MAKTKLKYVCEFCGAEHAKWAGKCSACGSWNTLVQFRESTEISGKGGQVLEAQPVASIETESSNRLKTNHKDLDELLGGGIVPGSVILVAGEPGIGKSTLLLQIAEAIAGSGEILYASGEESAGQISLRAKRLGAKSDNLKVVNSNSADDIATSIAKGKFTMAVVDSIQTVSLAGVASAPGTVSQITNSLSVLSRQAKASRTALVVVGHVTKDGSIAGPKLLEHLVDVVLYFEGDRLGGFRILRTEKNRFGSTNESAIYEMNDKGLEPVANPSEALLKERQVSDGSVVLATMQGSRPLLVEVQALVNTTHFGYPKRAGSGIDVNRLNLLVAVLGKRTKLNLADKDIYVNVVGGIKLIDPGADLAICMAIASAAKGMKLKDDAVVFGEVGLSGELRHVSFIEKRAKEAQKLGFSYSIGPGAGQIAGYKPVKDLRQALNTYLSK